MWLNMQHLTTTECFQFGKYYKAFKVAYLLEFYIAR